MEEKEDLESKEQEFSRTSFCLDSSLLRHLSSLPLICYYFLDLMNCRPSIFLYCCYAQNLLKSLLLFSQYVFCVWCQTKEQYYTEYLDIAEQKKKKSSLKFFVKNNAQQWFCSEKQQFNKLVASPHAMKHHLCVPKKHTLAFAQPMDLYKINTHIHKTK